MYQQLLFPECDSSDPEERSGTFADNTKLPVHRWYRYTAGFSAAWVGSLLDRENKLGRCRVLDPFAGSGTVPVEALLHGFNSIGVEANPYVYEIANAKLLWHSPEGEHLPDRCFSLLENAKKKCVALDGLTHPPLIERCFPKETLMRLDALKFACREIEDPILRRFAWFVLTAILRSTSPVGTAQWQYIQPRKTKSKVLDPFIAFRNKLFEIRDDIRAVQSRACPDLTASIKLGDARDLGCVPNGWADLVVTSPPYANNYDYADAMRLEMYFWDDIKDWEDLQQKVSSKLIRACTQHVASLREECSALIDSPLLSPIHDELANVYSKLEVERTKHGGKKNYHLMIAAYFHDMAKVFSSLSRVTSSNAKMCFVIGDSAPYGIYVPVDEWMGKLAMSSGFSDWCFEKLRDRNVKWKNRKHRVPLKEGRLWIRKQGA